MLEVSDVSGMDVDEFPLEDIEFFFAFPGSLVNAVFQERNFVQKTLPVVGVLTCLGFYLSQQFGDLVIFDCDDLLESVELDAEHLALILEVFLQSFKFEIDHFFELFLQLSKGSK